MEGQGLPTTGKGSRLERPARELMAEAHQARAEGLRNMNSGLGRRLRSIVAMRLLPAKEPAAGGAPPSELDARHGT